MSSYSENKSVPAIWHWAQPPYSAAWYDGFVQVERQFRRMTNDVDETETTQWLTLPLARREVALLRRDVMLEYERHASPGDREVQEAARRMGITSGQFYRLRRQWAEKRSVFSLVPYGAARRSGRRQLDAEVAEAVSTLVTKAVEHTGARSPSQILRLIQDEWSLEKPIPSHMTLRRTIAAKLSEVSEVAGNIVFSSATIPQELVDRATAYGKVVVIDHIPLKTFVASEGGPVAPIVSMVIDLHTSSICGVHSSFGVPGPLQFEAVLQDAASRSARHAASGTTIVPELVFTCGGNSDWSSLLKRLEVSEMPSHVRRAQRMEFGDTISRLIGHSIDHLEFSRGKWLNDLAFNRLTDTLVSFSQLQSLIEAGVKVLNGKRLPTGLVLPELRFPF